MTTILVTGANGHVGRRIAERLLSQGFGVRLMTRHPAKLVPVPGSEVVQGDYVDPSSLDMAFRGIDRAFIVSGYAAPGARALLHKNAFEAAARAQVEHVLYLSFQGASPSSKFAMSRDHAQSEHYLAATGLSFTAQRDNWYMDLLPSMFNAQGIIRGPANQGEVAFVSREDVAQAVAARLAQPSSTSETYEVTGPEALTLAEVAQRLSALVGRPLRYEEESREEAYAWRNQLGAPSWEVDSWVGSYEAFAAGELAQTSDAVRKLIGREPFTLEKYFTSFPHLLEPLRTQSPS